MFEDSKPETFTEMHFETISGGPTFKILTVSIKVYKNGRKIANSEGVPYPCSNLFFNPTFSVGCRIAPTFGILSIFQNLMNCSVVFCVLNRCYIVNKFRMFIDVCTDFWKYIIRWIYISQLEFNFGYILKETPPQYLCWALCDFQN